jgi:CheY-like chemotaxis protein
VAANENIMLKVSVSDTGIGIAPEKIGLIFQSFTQADSSTNREFGGSGLGLTIVKEMIERMGGQLGVESQTNQGRTSAHITEDLGSTFWFTVPLQVAQVSTLPSETNHKLLEEIDYKGGVQVLLVDDNEINQRLAAVMLKNMGCEVSIAGDGQEAIGKVNQENFQLILMDIQMPVLNGYQATKYMREKLKLTTPIIGLSANVYKEEIDLCYAAGMNDYLSKPYTEKSLREKILRWIPINIEEKRKAVKEKPGKVGGLTNLDFLVQLFNGDKESIEEMINDFISQQQEQIMEMATFLQANEYQKLAAVAHNMRSSIVTVGLDALRQPLLDLEGLVKRAEAHSSLEEKFTQIKAINQAAIDELQSNQ